MIKTYLEVLHDKITDLEKQVNLYKYDDLTGLKQRGDFKREFREMFESGISFYLILADVNKLKKANTDGGYDAGDKLILECVKHLKACDPTGEDEFIFRYSGDEFCILFPFDRGYRSDDLNCPSKICTLATKFSGDFVNSDELFKAANKLLLKRKEEFYKLNPNDRREY